MYLHINRIPFHVLYEQVLDVSVFGDSGSSSDLEASGNGPLADDSVMSAMETQILPEVNEVVTLICVFAIFKVSFSMSLRFPRSVPSRSRLT